MAEAGLRIGFEIDGAEDFSWTLGSDSALSHERHIANGAHGEVHELRDNRDHVFARKIVRVFGDTTLEVILKEVIAAVTLCQAGHKNIVTVFRVGRLRPWQCYFFDMELCHFNLEDYIHRDWSPTDATKMPSFNDCTPRERMIHLWHIIADITRGVAFIHSNQKVHRDIKPSNVLYCPQDESWKIADFGLTRDGTSERAHTTRYARGTAGYRAPELLQAAKHQFTNKVDIWAIGCILFELASRRKAFADDFTIALYIQSNGQTLKLPSTSDTLLTEDRRTFVSNMIFAMLEINERRRPRAEDIHTAFVSWDVTSPLQQQSYLKTTSHATETPQSVQTENMKGTEEMHDDSRVIEIPVDTPAMGFYPTNSGISNLSSDRSISLPPPHCWTLSFEKCAHFIGRDEILFEIRRKFETRKAHYSQNRILLFGRMGVGKTEVAKEYCWQYKMRYRWIFWINAATQSQLVSGLTMIAERTGCAVSGNRFERAQVASKWLQGSGDWLLILDDLHETSLLTTYVPTTDSGGHILITTRNHYWEDALLETLEIAGLNPEDSVCLLLHRAGFINSNPEVRRTAAQIVETIGGLPLAIEQAGAYIQHTGDIFNYLETYRSVQKLVITNATKPVAIPYDMVVRMVCEVSIRYLQEKNHDAVSLLQFLSFLDPTGLPLSFVHSRKDILGEQLKRIIADEVSLAYALQGLHSLSLIKSWEEGRVVMVPSIVEMAVKSSLMSEQRMVLLTQVLGLIATYIVKWDRYRNESALPDYRAHILACLLRLNDFDSFTESSSTLSISQECYRIIELVAVNLFEDGYKFDARRLRELQLRMTETTRGPKDLQTLRSMTSLAELYGILGKLEDGIRTGRQALAIRKAVYGTDHPDTVWNMEILASLYQSAGEIHNAVDQYEALLEVQKRIYPPGSIDILKAMSLLGWNYQLVARYSDAAQLLEKAADLWSAHRGPEDLETQLTYRGVAAAYIQLGRWERAAEISEASVAILTSMLGSDHRDTMIATCFQALAYLYLERVEEAACLFEQALERQHRVLGLNHPETLITKTNLALAYIDLDRTTEAKRLLQETLEIQRAVLGKHHVDTLWTMHAQALAHERVGEFEDALLKFEETLKTRRRVLGGEHIDTLRSVHGMASVYKGLGLYENAITLFEEALTTRQKVLERGHPDLLRTGKCLDQCRKDFKGQMEEMNL